MSTSSLLVLLLTVGVLTFLYRYSMIGLLAGRSLPAWLHALCRYIAPASFPDVASMTMSEYRSKLASSTSSTDIPS